MKKIFSTLFVFSFISSCFSQKELSNIFERKLKVIQIENHESLYLLTTVTQNSQDTIDVVVHKESFYKKYKIINEVNPKNGRNITVGNVYSFKLYSTRFNINNQTHARYIIAERDTLWKEGDRGNSVPYFSANTNGLLIKE